MGAQGRATPPVSGKAAAGMTRSNETAPSEPPPGSIHASPADVRPSCELTGPPAPPVAGWLTQAGASKPEPGGENPLVSPAEAVALAPGTLQIVEARYGWADDLWRCRPSADRHGSGAKDVTGVVCAMAVEDELLVNPNCQPMYMTRTFWPETASGPLVPRRLGVRYRYGDGPVETETTEAVADETVSLRITRAKYASGGAVVPGTQTMSRGDDDGVRFSRDFLAAEDLTGCWGCVAWPFFAACEYKRADGNDVLWHQGICLPCFLPYKEAWDRVGSSNTFRKRLPEGEESEDIIPYDPRNPGFHCWGAPLPGCSWRWCK